MATVFLALDVALNRKVAIKVMSPNLMSSSESVERFKREAKVAAALNHPNIIGIHAVGDSSDLAYYVMKFVEGRSLDSVIRDDGPQSVPFVQAVMQYAGNALHYAHQRGVVHRDVKPANFMLDKDGWLIITDFGIAKVEEAKSLTSSGMMLGTPYYMSPEQFNGTPVGATSDQYALGVVIFELLTGKTPFHAATLGEVMRGHLLDAPPPVRDWRPDVPMEVEACINRMLEKSPVDRFPSLSDAVQTFGAIKPAEEQRVRSHIIGLARSGSLLQPRMPMPMSPASPFESTGVKSTWVMYVAGALLVVFSAIAGGLAKSRMAQRPNDIVSAGAVSDRVQDVTPTLLGRSGADSVAVLRPKQEATVLGAEPTGSGAEGSSRPVAVRSEGERPSTPAPSRPAPPSRGASALAGSPATALPDASPVSSPAESVPVTSVVDDPPPTTPPMPADRGLLRIRTNEDGVSVYFGGDFKLNLGTLRTEEVVVPVGVIRVSLRKPGCSPAVAAVTVSAGQVSVLERTPSCSRTP